MGWRGLSQWLTRRIYPLWSAHCGYSRRFRGNDFFSTLLPDTALTLRGIRKTAQVCRDTIRPNTGGYLLPEPRSRSSYTAKHAGTDVTLGIEQGYRANRSAQMVF